MSPGPAVHGKGAAGDQAAVFVGASTHLAGHVRGWAAGDWPEATLHDGTVSAAPDPGGVGPSASEQLQARHDHGLARAGLTGYHGQAGVQVQGGLVDHTEALDAHLGEHGPHPSAPRPALREAPPSSSNPGSDGDDHEKGYGANDGTSRPST